MQAMLDERANELRPAPAEWGARVALATSSQPWGFVLHPRQLFSPRLRQLMTNPTPPVTDTEKVSQEAEAGSPTTGEGADSAMVVMRDRRDVDLVARAELDTDSAGS